MPPQCARANESNSTLGIIQNEIENRMANITMPCYKGMGLTSFGILSPVLVIVIFF